MERADRNALGVAIAGHVLLFAALSLSIAKRSPPVTPAAEVMDVQLVDAVGLRSAAPEPATEAPQEMQAPDSGTPQEAPPPPPQAAPPPPTPALPTPAPPKPPESVAPAPKPKPASAKPAPAKPTPPKPEAKPKPTPAKAQPSRDLSDILKDVSSKARSERAGSDAKAKADRAQSAKVGDLLKGVIGASAGRGENARAAVTGAAMNGLAAAIKRQVQPCYELGGLGGTPAMQIVTVLRLRYNPDGSVAGAPQIVEQTGVTPANQAYKQQIAEVARRAVLRCAPVKLPAELYEGGWDDLNFRFTPGQMQ
jgi:outer membrane biosynthesis protein TonB